MDIDQPPPSRKRPLSSLANHDNDDDGDDINTNNDNNTPSKRLQSSHGLPIPQNQPYHLKTHLILNSLALTRLRVTANFSLYNPPTSPILLSITRSDDTLYRLLCSILPSLYPLSPTLQTLCIMPAEQPSFNAWASSQRLVPICTTADLDEEAAGELRAFLEDVAATPDLLVLFDARGRSVWSSVDSPLRGEQMDGGGSTVLRKHLGRALGGMMPAGGREDGEAMELG